MKLIIFNIKLIVVVIVFCKIVSTLCLNYCNVCVNHTLCKYPSPGPSLSCKTYDSSSRLSDDDILNLVQKMNERRNFVALGLSRNLPPAANMRKLKWSRELATFAQRWVDQCDTTLPGKEDECRDLVNTKVGQNIATVFGATPGMNVGSFVEIWFMQTLHYTGGVSYFNQSQNFKTNYLTQLIWAETNYVGCGKAKFFSISKKTTIERLVCNFAEKGNQHGKPVYSIGFAATQCPRNMGPDEKFQGLCRYKQNVEASTQTPTTVSSLLRILNLSNDTAKQDIVTSDWKSYSIKYNRSRNQRNQKIRHIFSNHPSGSVRNFQPLRYQNNKYRPLNLTRDYLLPHIRHDKSQPNIFDHNFNNFEFPQNDFQKKSVVSTTKKYFARPFESFSKPSFGMPLNRIPSLRNRCTRKQHYQNRVGNNVIVQVCSRTPDNNNCYPNCGNDNNHVNPHVYCPCSSSTQQHRTTTMRTTTIRTTTRPFTTSTKSTTNPTTSQSSYNSRGGCQNDCRCKPPECPTTECARLLRKQLNRDEGRDSPEFHYYDDLLPKLTFRSGDLSRENSRYEFYSNDKPRYSEMYPRIIKENEPPSASIKDYNNVEKQIEDNSDYLHSEQDLPKHYFYDYYNVRQRVKRNDEDELNNDESSDVKPFWQMDESYYKNPSDLRFLRYTTLNSKRRRKSRKTTTMLPVKTSTEPITFMLKEIADYHNDFRNSHYTEKYLSFEELMRLRKLSTVNEDEFDLRRGGKATPKKTTPKKPPAKTTTKAKTKATTKPKNKPTTKATKATPKTTTKKVDKVTTKGTTKAATTKASTNSTEEVTVKTTFIRQKYCTRLLTCTWTPQFPTGPDGSPISDYKGIDIGSRTPAGYVEGCTRTSTCTRDFMERNVNEDTGNGDIAASEDEDYCERKSLSIKRRNSEVNQSTENSYSLEKAYTEIPMTTNPMVSNNNNSFLLKKELNNDENDCLCEVQKRKKRQNGVENDLSYGDLFYLVLRKILQTRYGSKHKNCLCNANQSTQNTSRFNIIYLSLHYFILNYI